MGGAKKPDSWRVAGTQLQMTQLLCLAGELKNPLAPPASPSCTSVTVGLQILNIMCPVFPATSFASSSALDLFLLELQTWAHHRTFAPALLLARILSLGHTWLPNTFSFCLNVGVTLQSWLPSPHENRDPPAVLGSPLTLPPDNPVPY